MINDDSVKPRKWKLNLLLPPYQKLSYLMAPPYTSVKPLSSWSTLSAQVDQVALTVQPEGEKALVDEWVKQLIVLELGETLRPEDNLHIDLPMDTVHVILEALARRAPKC